jgi:poly(beta-D-mannuronate) lyase
MTSTNLTPGPAAVTASSNDGNVPGNTVDGSLFTRWSANGDGQWLRLDLGALHTVSLVNIAFFRGNERVNRFDLQVSSDGSVWTTVLAGQTSSGATTSFETFELGDVPARYVRYVGHGNNFSNWNSLTEVQIWGTP